jgi:hypothetical protein
MLEKQFQTIIKRSLSLYFSNNGIVNYHYYKIADLGFTNPYDCFVKFNKRYIGIELKVNRLKNTFNFKSLFGNGKQYHEIMNLKKDIDIGFEAWVIIAHQEGREFTAYAITPDNADRYYKQGSIKLEDMEYIRIPRIKNTFTNELVYDLTPIFDEKI